ncbi:MAG: hypothetical protein EOP39_09070 [Rubrivivax sp.]|nr:MAG: hypothetical protein EOP39_09070 [Rubrivivax sp.]
MTMKNILSTAALAIAFAVPAAEARVPTRHGDSHASASVKAKTAKTAKTAKKAGKAKHKKHGKKRSHKNGL